MNISTLEAYVAQKNQWTRIFKGKELSLLNAKDRQRIADMIDSDLSPESLTCDGELSRSVVQLKYKKLTTAAAQLKKVDPAVTFYEFN